MEREDNVSRKPLKIVFFGTPEFAVASLDKILQSGHDVSAVVTAPDKPAGRGRKLRESDVKKYARNKGLKIFQPEDLKDPSFIEALKNLNPDVGVVVAFRKIPKEVYTIPRLGTFNLHASLLPDYRGAAPINHVIINGEKKTGVTTFFINDRIDSGEIIIQEEITIEKDETAGSLHDKLKYLGAEVVVKTLKKLSRGNVETIQQDPIRFIHKAPKLNKDNTRINWDENGEKIERFIRGLSPYPGAWSWYKISKDWKKIKIFLAEFQPEKHNFLPGKVAFFNKKLKIAVPDGWILPLRVKPESKKEMNIQDFINGIKSVEELTFK